MMDLFRKRWLPALFFLLLIAHACAVFLFPVFPNQDGPVHLYYAQVVAGLWENPDAYGGLFEIQHRFPPYALHSYALIFLNLLFSPALSGKILVAGQLLLLSGGFAYLVTAVNRRWNWGVLLVFPLLLHRFVFMGFQGFNIGIGILLCFLGYWLRYHSRMSRSRSLVFLLLLALLLWAHPMPLLIAVCLIAAHTAVGVILEVRNSRLRSALASRGRQVLHVGIAGAVLLYLTAFLGGGTFEGLSFDGERIGGQLHRLYIQEPITPLYDPGIWWSLTLLSLAGLAAAVLALHYPGSDVRRWDHAFVLAAGASCLAFFLLGPPGMSGGLYFDVRFPLVGYLLIFAAASGLRVPDRSRMAVAVAITLLSSFTLARNLRTLYPWSAKSSVLLDAPLMKRFTKGAIVAGGEFYERVHPPYFWFSPFLWSPVHYFTRSDAVLLNTPWVSLPWIMVTTRVQPSYFSQDPPPLGRLYQASFSGDRIELPPELDFFIGVDCTENAVHIELFQQIAANYNLERMPWSTPEYVFYANPDMLRNPRAD